MAPPPRAFTAVPTLRGGGLVLETPVGISLPMKEPPTGPIPFLRAVGIWDTGASCTTIDISLVQRLGLREIDRVSVRTAKGVREAGCYFVAVHLPNDVIIPELLVTDGEILGGPESPGNVLIGMDVIGSGDFAVSNFQDQPTFTFRMPSQERFDFSGNQGSVLSERPQPKIGRNAPCPCGSGKKYKKCHGAMSLQLGT